MAKPVAPKHLSAHLISLRRKKKSPGRTTGKEQKEVPKEDDDFFKEFASVGKCYETTKRSTIERYRLSRKVSSGLVAKNLWPSLAGCSVKILYRQVLFDMIQSFKSKEKLLFAGRTLLSHLQSVFQMETEEHEDLLNDAVKIVPPPRVLHLEVIEAKGLTGTDTNGLSDPFCTVYVGSGERHNTSVQFATLFPQWKEYFSLRIKNVEEDSLVVEVWDYDDPQETISDKFRKISEINSASGLRSFIKGIASPAVQGSHTKNESHGSTQVLLKTIPSDNFDAWFPLRTTPGANDEITGQIRLRMTVAPHKDKNVASQEYRHVLYLLLIYELDSDPKFRYTWGGRFSKPESETILRRLQHQGGLLPRDVDLAKWLVYTQVQSAYPLDTRIFAPLFLRVLEQSRKGNLDRLDVTSFWSATKGLVEAFAEFIIRIHDILMHNNVEEANESRQIIQTLALLKDLLKMEKKDGVEETKKEMEECTVDCILTSVTNALSKGAEELFSTVCLEKSVENLEDLRSLITLGQILIGDLQNGIQLLQRHFQSLLNIDYFEITYRVYDAKYSMIAEMLVKKVSANLKPLDRAQEAKDTQTFQEQDMLTKTALFELYLALKQFADLSSTLKSKEGLRVEGNYYIWFYSGVSHWLDIAWYKAEKRIKVAIQLDDFSPVCEDSQLSSSAIDSTQVFHQILYTWDQLFWPDASSASALIAKIIDDLCNCVMYYSQVICKKWEGLDKPTNQLNDEACRKLCTVINNIEHLGLEIGLIRDKLKLDQIYKELESQNGTLCMTRYMSSVNTIMENGKANVGSRINQSILKLWKKMEPQITQLFGQIIDVPIQTSNEGKDDPIDALMTYLEKNLILLRDRLTDAAFAKLLAGTWDKISKLIHSFTLKSVERKRDNETFKRIRTLTKCMLSYFRDPDNIFETDECALIKEIQEIVNLHGANTVELILQYQMGRSSGKFKGTETGSIAIIAVYCQDEETLKIEVLNCRNLKAKDRNGVSDPFVRIEMSPRPIYPDVLKVKTKVQKNTLFPLFDEKFDIHLKREKFEQCGLIHLTVKDHNLIGRNDFIGDAFIPTASVPTVKNIANFKEKQQQQLLNITTPGDSLLLQTLENRLGDKVAIDFVGNPTVDTLSSLIEWHQTEFIMESHGYRRNVKLVLQHASLVKTVSNLSVSPEASEVCFSSYKCGRIANYLVSAELQTRNKQ